MGLTDTATLCQSMARARVAPRRHLVASAAGIGLFMAVFAPAASAHGCSNANTPIAAASRAQLQRSVVCLVNRQRTERRLPRLHTSRRLNRSAQGWTNAMVRSDSFTHGANFAARITAVGFVWSLAGENIATGFSTPAQVVRGWMASTGHCQNILSPSFANIGTGVSGQRIPGFASAGGTWTQDFGLPMGHHSPSTNTGPASGCPYG
jgi:uncharacterized protein YkwD